MTSQLSPAEMAVVIKDRAAIGERLIAELTGEQLSLPTKPTRARSPSVAETMQGILIDHIDSHRTSIEDKLGG